MENENIESNQQKIDLAPLQNAVENIRNEVKKIVVGQDKMVNLLLTSILANGHVLIEGVPGVAKTLTAKILAKCISADFSRIQFTPDLMPSDVLGTNVYNFKTSEFDFKRGPIFSNIILIDEVNRSPAKTQSALFEVMEERQVTIDATTYSMQLPFIVFATQNPIEQEGTYQLPEAQMDRFLYKIVVHYPEKQDEVNILKNYIDRSSKNDLSIINPVVSGNDIRGFQELCTQIYIEEKLMEYIVEIVTSTRNHPDLFLGASPRASLAILNAGRAFAAINGRDFVTPDDVKTTLKPVLRHRIMLTPEKEMEGSNTDEVIDEIMKSVEIPR